MRAAPFLLAAIGLVLFAADADARAVGGGSLAGACALNGTPCPAQAHPSTQESAANELAQRYAPIVYLKTQSEACDNKGEAYAPVAVEAVLDNADNVLRQQPDDAGVSAPGASGLFGKGEEYYLDLPGDPAKAGCTYDTAFKSFEAAAPRVTYAHVVTEPGNRGVALQYWFYYYFNDWNNNHESDWEMIQLFFDVDTVEEALAVGPDHAGYSQHSGGEYAAWDADKLRREGPRPLVYVAAGSHSNQYQDQKYLGRAEEGAGFGCDDATGPSTRIEPEVRLVPDVVTQPDDPFAWITYEGRWGERKSGEFNGPTGPNTKTQWTKPVTWDETKLRDSNVEVPTTRTAGVSPSDAFCAVVAFVSERLLEVVKAAPWIVPAVLLFAAAALFVTVRNTSFGAARHPLRRHRRFGQILRTSFSLYRSNALLLIGIALVFVPAGLIAGAIQSALGRFTPLAALSDVAAAPRIVDVVLAIAFGAAVFGVAYLIVVTGVVAALPDIEKEHDVSPLRAYRIVLSHARNLLRARLRALAIVALLAISIVGMPWAIRRMIDWLFIEQAILLDSAPPQDADDLSRAAVRGDWWRTFIITTVLLLIGVITSLVVVTPIILFFTAIPLGLVNGISSLIYILISPFVALALTLLYFDVCAEPAGLTAP